MIGKNINLKLERNVGTQSAPGKNPFSPYPPLSPKNRNPVPSIPDAS